MTFTCTRKVYLGKWLVSETVMLPYEFTGTHTSASLTVQGNQVSSQLTSLRVLLQFNCSRKCLQISQISHVVNRISWKSAEMLQQLPNVQLLMYMFCNYIVSCVRTVSHALAGGFVDSDTRYQIIR